MDADRFDAVVRSLPRVAPRRNALTGALAVSLSTLLARFRGEGAEAAKKKKTKKKRKKNKCKAPRVRCGKACCPDGQVCLGGQCGTPQQPQSPPPPLPTCPPPPPPSPPVGPGACGYNGTSGSFSGALRYAQTFLTPAAKPLISVEIGLRANSSGLSLLFEIRTVDQAGLPADSVLASAEVSNISSGASLGSGLVRPVVATFAAPVTLELGQSYSLTVTDLLSKGYAIHANDSGNRCPDGAMFQDTFATNEFFSLGGGSADMVYILTFG